MSETGLGPRRDTGSLCLASTCTDSVVIVVTTPQTQWTRASLGPHSLGVMMAGHAALLSTTEPGVGPGGVNSRCSCLPPTLSLHLELDLLTAIPSRASSLVFWRTHWAGADAGQAAHGTESWEAGEPQSDCLQVPQAGTGRVLLRNRSLRARSSLILCQDAAASGWPLLLCL